MAPIDVDFFRRLLNERKQELLTEAEKTVDGMDGNANFPDPTDRAALECARANVLASKQPGRIQLAPWDARALPLAGASVDVICADLPFGHDVGSHGENKELYPLLLKEAARVARPGARCVLLTHEIHLMEGLLENMPEWQVQDILQLSLAGLHPRIYILALA